MDTPVLRDVNGRELETLPPTASVDDVCEATDRDGAAIVTDLLDASTVGTIVDELGPHLDATSASPRPGGGSPAGYGARTKRLQGLIARSDAVVACMIHPLVLAWAARQLAEHSGDFQLSSAELIEIGPSEPAQPLHADGALLWPAAYGPHRPDTMVTCMYALTDFTEANGATRVVPGSHEHHVDLLDPTDPPATVPAELRAGSALLFIGRVWHGGGPNATDNEYRRGIAVTYAAGWVRPEEALCLSVPQQRVRRLPRRLQELIGYKSYVHRTGHILWGYDKRDAAAALDGPLPWTVTPPPA